MDTLNKPKALLNKDFLLDLFKQQGPTIKFKSGLSLDLYKNQVMISLNLKTDDDKYQATIITDYVSADSLIALYQIKGLEDIQHIKSGDLWLKYLAGNAYVCIEVFELEAEFCFRLVNGITIVYCRELHYYDEVYSILSMVPHFEKYIVDNRSKLEFATERKWKW